MVWIIVAISVAAMSGPARALPRCSQVVGQRCTYRVKPSDTVEGIAERFGLAVDDVSRESAPLATSRLQVGERVVIAQWALAPHSEVTATSEAASLLPPEQARAGWGDGGHPLPGSGAGRSPRPNRGRNARPGPGPAAPASDPGLIGLVLAALAGTVFGVGTTSLVARRRRKLATVPRGPAPEPPSGGSGPPPPVLPQPTVGRAIDHSRPPSDRVAAEEVRLVPAILIAGAISTFPESESRFPTGVNSLVRACPSCGNIQAVTARGGSCKSCATALAAGGAYPWPRVVVPLDRPWAEGEGQADGLLASRDEEASQASRLDGR